MIDARNEPMTSRDLRHELKPLMRDGLVERRGRRFVLTDLGRRRRIETDTLDAICKMFAPLPYLAAVGFVLYLIAWACNHFRVMP